MPLKPFDTFPDEARLWSFACNRELDAAEEAEFLGRMDAFLDSWQAHGHALDVARDWRDGRFLLVAVDETTAPPSGCSIDALMHTLQAEGRRLNAELVGNSRLWYRDRAGRPTSSSRAEFAAAATRGEVDSETTVFDFTVLSLADVRAGRWETRAADAWHARAFALSATVPEPSS